MLLFAAEVGLEVLKGLESVRLWMLLRNGVVVVVTGDFGKVRGEADGGGEAWCCGLLAPPPEEREGRSPWPEVLGSAWTFLTPWKGRMAGIEWVPTCLLPFVS